MYIPNVVDIKKLSYAMCIPTMVLGLQWLAGTAPAKTNQTFKHDNIMYTMHSQFVPFEIYF